jgi:hypothetical protein
MFEHPSRHTTAAPPNHTPCSIGPTDQNSLSLVLLLRRARWIVEESREIGEDLCWRLVSIMVLHSDDLSRPTRPSANRLVARRRTLTHKFSECDDHSRTRNLLLIMLARVKHAGARRNTIPLFSRLSGMTFLRAAIPFLGYCWSMIFSENRYPPRIKSEAGLSQSCSNSGALAFPSVRPAWSSCAHHRMTRQSACGQSRWKWAARRHRPGVAPAR